MSDLVVLNQDCSYSHGKAQMFYIKNWTTLLHAL